MLSAECGIDGERNVCVCQDDYLGIRTRTRTNLGVAVTRRFVRACSYAKIVVLTNAGSPILRIAMPPRDCHAEVRACVFVCQDSRLEKRRVTNIADCYASKVRETQVCKSTTLLHESRRGSDHTQNTSIWPDQRLTPIM